jgi:hypothetical protein
MTMAATRTDLGLSASMPTTIAGEHLFDLHVDLAPAQTITGPDGTRMIFTAQGGRLEGDRIRGEMLPGGGDWLRVGTDAVGRIDVRATIRTHDGELIFMTNRGVIALGDDGAARFAAGEDVPWDAAYIRSTPLFETGAEAYAWLNATVTVAINELGPGYVNYRIFAVR